MTRIAVVQMNTQAIADLNLLKAESLIRKARQQGAEFVLLPEYFSLISPTVQERVAAGEAYGHGPVQEALQIMAEEHGIWLAAGTVPLQSHHAERVFNSQLLFSPEGKCCGRYDKIHLFCFSNDNEAYREADFLCPGTEICDFELPFGAVRPSVCYDLRFPELYRLQPGYNLITAPAAFTYTTGQAHWELLLRARAVENLSYVAAAAQTGLHADGSRTWGHSMIISPWGEVLAALGEEEGVVTAELDLAELARYRQQLPALDNRIFF